MNEQIALERLLQNMQPMLERLEQEARYAVAQVDVAELKTAHDGLIVQKQSAYDRIAHAVAEVHQAFRALEILHDSQVGPLQALRQPRIGEPAIPTRTGGEVVRDVISRMPQAHAWLQALCDPTSHALTKGDLAQMMDVDPGLRELNPRILEPSPEEGERKKLPMDILISPLHFLGMRLRRDG